MGGAILITIGLIAAGWIISRILSAIPFIGGCLGSIVLLAVGLFAVVSAAFWLGFG